MPRDVDHVISVRRRWSGGQGGDATRYAVLRIWYDGHVDDLGEETDREAALARANQTAVAEKTVYMRAPDEALPDGGHSPMFGAIPGVRPGQSFRRRADLQSARLHRGSQGGID